VASWRRNEFLRRTWCEFWALRIDAQRLEGIITRPSPRDSIYLPSFEAAKRASVSSRRKRVETTECFRSGSQYLRSLVATIVPCGRITVPGYPTRLNRPTLNEGYRFGDPNYAKEESRAELASVFLSAARGIPHNPEQHAAYVGSWIKALQGDKNEVFRTAKDAHKAADVDPQVRVEQMGHAVDVTENVYTRTSLERRREAGVISVESDVNGANWSQPTGSVLATD
jgi:hypothetical protein